MKKIILIIAIALYACGGAHTSGQRKYKIGDLVLLKLNNATCLIIDTNINGHDYEINLSNQSFARYYINEYEIKNKCTDKTNKIYRVDCIEIPNSAFGNYTVHCFYNNGKYFTEMILLTDSNYKEGDTITIK